MALFVLNFLLKSGQMVGSWVAKPISIWRGKLAGGDFLGLLAGLGLLVILGVLVILALLVVLGLLVILGLLVFLGLLGFLVILAQLALLVYRQAQPSFQLTS